MYCSSCGAAVTQSSSYCKRCGEKLGGAKGEGVGSPAELVPDYLVGGMIATFILGLGVIIGLMAVMKKVLHFNDGLIIFFSMLSFLLMLVIEYVLISQIPRRRRGPAEVGDTTRLKEQSSKEPGAAQQRALAEPAPSVTEHTTRSFEPVYGERNTE